MRRNDQFPVLSSIASFLNFMGWALVVVAGIGALIVFGISKDSPFAFVGALVGGILVAAVGFLIVMFAEWTGVFFAIEKNSRQSAQHIERVLRTNALGASDLDSIPSETTSGGEAPETVHCPSCNAPNTATHWGERMRVGQEMKCASCGRWFQIRATSVATGSTDVGRLLKCPSCDAENEIRYLKPGEEAKCKSCGNTFQVPPLSA